MSISLDMDVSDLIKLLRKKKGGAKPASPVESNKPAKASKAAALTDSPYKKTIMAAAVVLLFFGAFMMGIHSPYVAANQEKRQQLLDAKLKMSEMSTIDTSTHNLKQQLLNSKEDYTELLSNFDDHEDFGSLYEAISNLAMVHKLTVYNIKETDRVHSKEKINGILLKESEVHVELKGSFNNYLAFKEALDKEKALLTTHTEVIKVLNDEDNRGKVTATLGLLTYTIDKSPFERLVSSIEEPNINVMVADNE